MKLLDRRTFLSAGAATALSLHRPLAFAAPAQQVWTFDNLQRIGGRPVTLEGQPKLVPSPWGNAVAFDGQADALFIDEHPLAGAATFTFEALFRPDGGAFEQRWFHLESDEQPPVAPGKGGTRILFEIRVVRDEWYLDAFAKGPGYAHALVVPEKLFPTRQWYHVAQTYDGERYRSYVNGQLQTEFALPFKAQGAGRASIGVRMNRVSYFHGAVREARFTHAPLPPAEFSLP
ncbi:MAG TPA: LamG domain-containing protein [Steroidobacter sp.]|uniref:LamG domain-containing protein n=1 Tax=Steroidobacter sp. TaxID=1978227 RepID=UPI002EDBAD0D